MPVSVLHYDAFASAPGKGNPAGVVLAGRSLSPETMQTIASRVGFNETAFVRRADASGVHLQFFTPGHEVDLCGHATVASFVALHDQGILCRLSPASAIKLETRAGLLPMQVDFTLDGKPLVWMGQPSARFVRFEGSRAAVAGMLGLLPDDLDPHLPIIYGNTGLWTLVVPVMGLGAMRRMVPASSTFPSIMGQMPRASVHPFCLETYDPAAQMHGRHFSSPFSGTVEDPVTGTASGVLGAYFIRHVLEHPKAGWRELLVEQGQELDKDGRIRVEVRWDESGWHPRIGGTGVFVKTMGIEV